ncbi:hypothetical protein [Niallia taxi]|uniref:hypothetical protein n=1 Tax=Niallia taxi TaxID=2499688 RepID=UPI0015F4C1DD|nr:hypothetical protein [Niallia taxi]
MIHLLEFKKSLVTILIESITQLNLVYSALEHYLDVLHDDMDEQESNKDEVFSLETLIRELYEQEDNLTVRGIEVVISSLELSPLIYALSMYEGVLEKQEETNNLNRLRSIKDQAENAVYAFGKEISHFYLLNPNNRFDILKEFQKRPFGSVIRGFKKIS